MADNSWSWADQYGGAADDDENAEDSGYSQTRWVDRDGLVFLIDCSKDMFSKEGDKACNMDLCLKSCQNVIQEKIISSPADLMGIVFFATDQSKNIGEFKNIYVFQELIQPGAEEVLALEKLKEGIYRDQFDYGHSDRYSLSDALWTCSNLFSKSAKKVGSARVLLFTCNDDPHAGNQQMKNLAKTKMTDLDQMGVDLELMPMPRQGHVFSEDTFYSELLPEGHAVGDTTEKLEELLARMYTKINKKRGLTKIPLSLGPGLQMAVGVYTMVRAATKPTPIKLYKKTNEEVKTVTRYFTDTGDLLMQHDMKKGQDWAGRTISFENDEIAQMKKFDSFGLSLMGFKPKSCLKRHHHVRPCQFIYPEESKIKGSTTLFTALLRKCLEKDVVAVCTYTPRRNTTPRFVALLPQEEEVDEGNLQVTPPGFHVVFLPFADDFRKIKFAPTEKANGEQIDKAKEIIKKLRFNFSPENLDNPNLQTYYRNLEALALDRDAPEECSDLTMPNEEMIETRAGKLIEDFKVAVFPAGYDPGKKRKTATTGGAAKAVKLETVDLRAEAEGGRLPKLTVAALKEGAKTAGIKTSATKKADLIAAISQHFRV